MKYFILALILLLSGCLSGCVTFEKELTLAGKWEKVNPKTMISKNCVNSNVAEAQKIEGRELK